MSQQDEVHRFIGLLVLLVVLIISGCGDPGEGKPLHPGGPRVEVPPPPPPVPDSNLIVTITKDGSTVQLTYKSHAKTSKEAIQELIESLQQRPEVTDDSKAHTKAEVEEKPH